jgi:hypothetical protein
MKYQDALEELIAQGAIRLYRAGGAWAVAYRIKNGEIQARSMLKVAEDDWQLADTLVGYDPYTNKTGWFTVPAAHMSAKPIALESAKKNPGYYIGLTQQCQTCKQVKPLSEFERDMTGEMDYRTWECNQCAAERKARSADTEFDPEKMVGDYVKR